MDREASPVQPGRKLTWGGLTDTSLSHVLPNIAQGQQHGVAVKNDRKPRRMPCLKVIKCLSQFLKPRTLNSVGSDIGRKAYLLITTVMTVFPLSKSLILIVNAWPLLKLPFDVLTGNPEHEPRTEKSCSGHDCIRVQYVRKSNTHAMDTTSS